MSDETKPLTSIQVLDIASDIEARLEKLPLVSHQAVFSMLGNLFQHRAMAAQQRLAEQQAQWEANQARAEKVISSGIQAPTAPKVQGIRS